MGEETTLNRVAPDVDLSEARDWVLHIQTKLHQWAIHRPRPLHDEVIASCALRGPRLRFLKTPRSLRAKLLKVEAILWKTNHSDVSSRDVL